MMCQRVISRTSYDLPDRTVSHVPLSFVCGREATLCASTPTIEAIWICADCLATLGAT